MLTLLSKSNSVKYEFSMLCKKYHKDYTIIESIFEMIEYAHSIRNGHILLDLENIDNKDLFLNLKNKSLTYNNMLIIDKNGDVKNISEAFAVIIYEENNGYFKDVEAVDKNIEKVIRKYGFSNNYDGYNHIKEICRIYILSRAIRLRFHEIVAQIAIKNHIENKQRIVRNIRYLIRINENDEIVRARGNANQVKSKAVIMFLLDKIKEMAWILYKNLYCKVKIFYKLEKVAKKVNVPVKTYCSNNLIHF